MNKTYYEILNISSDSLATDVDAAYARAKEVYGKDSVAMYSLYSDKERANLLMALDKAYKTLANPEARRRYNERLIKDEVFHKTTAEVDMFALGATNKMPRRVSKFKNTAHIRQTILESIGGNGTCSEQYRELLTKLEHISRKHSYSVFAVTSAVKGEGKTVTSINLSLAMMTELKMRVLLIECDMRSPSFGDYFEFAEDIPGMRDVLDGKAGLDESVARVNGTDLYIMHAGRELKAVPGAMSQGMKKVIDRARLEFDYVILDTPPIAPVADVKILTKFVDGLIMLVRADSTPRDMVTKALQSLPGANVLGIVLNGIQKSMNQYY